MKIRTRRWQWSLADLGLLAFRLACVLLNATWNVNGTSASSSSTPTPITPSTRGNSTTAGPIVPNFLWKVSGVNGTCVLFSVTNIFFQFPSEGPSSSQQTTSAQLLTEIYQGRIQVSGRCESQRAFLWVFWGLPDFPEMGSFNFSVSFRYKPETGTWLATRFSHQLHTDSNVQYVYGGEDYFQAPLDQAFRCNNRTTHSLDGRAVTSFGELMVQAIYFSSRDSFSEEVVYCPANSDPRSVTDVTMIAAISATSLLLLFIGACATIRTINSKMKTTLDYESL